MSTASLALHHAPAYRAQGRRSRLLQDAAVAVVVLALHGAALWALQNGLTEPATPPALALPRVITAQLIAAATPAPAPVEAPAPAAPPAIERPAPTPPEPVKPVARTEPARPVAPAKPRPEKKAPPRKPAPAMRKPPAPAPQAAPAIATPPEPAPSAPVAPLPSAAAQAPMPAPAATAPVPAPAPRTVLPSSSAAYLNNPPPPYPPLSRRLGESGVVVVRVLIGTNGRAEKAQIEKSSGYERLDHAALETARDRWRYVPGTRGGVPEAMWFNVPIKFVLE